MSLHVQKEITYWNEMNDKIFDIDMNAWDNAMNAINAINSISFRLFH
jgi:hypothetical protein